MGARIGYDRGMDWYEWLLLIALLLAYAWERDKRETAESELAVYRDEESQREKNLEYLAALRAADAASEKRKARTEAN